MTEHVSLLPIVAEAMSLPLGMVRHSKIMYSARRVHDFRRSYPKDVRSRNTRFGYGESLQRAALLFL